MVRQISETGLAKLATRLGNEPVTIIEVDWVAGGPAAIYADREVGTIPGRILQVSDLDNVVNFDSTGNSQQISIVLDDTDGSIKAIFNSHDIHKRDVRVYQWFEGLALTDRFLLFAGKISSPVTWSERERTISFSIVSQLEEKEIGFSAEEGQFPFLPKELVGKPWPMIFGKVLDCPALGINKVLEGFTLEGVDILAGADVHLAVPLARDDGADFYLDKAEHLAKANFLYECYRAWGSVDMGLALKMVGQQANSEGVMPSDEQMEARARDLMAKSQQAAAKYKKEADEIRNRVYNTVSQRDALLECARKKREETLAKIPRKTKIRILGGSDFPQGKTITLNIDGGLFTGRFEGDVFTIYSRTHEELEKQAEDALEDANSKACGNSTIEELPKERHWRFVMEAPPGEGDMFYRDENGNIVFPGDTMTVDEEDGRRVTYVARDLIVHDGSAKVISLTNKDLPSLGSVAKFFWAEAGSKVVLASDSPSTYIVSIVPGTVLAVKAMKRFNNLERLVTVPSDLYTVQSMSYGSITAVQIVLTQPLSTIPDEGWTDDLYVTFESSAGPNMVDILKHLISTYTDLSYDSASFDYVRSKVQPFPMNFALLERKNVVQALEEIAYQGRCALWLSNRVFYLKYLPEEPGVDSAITVSDLDSEAGIDVEYTSTESLVTKLVATWRQSLAQEAPNKIILRHNISKYGTHQQEIDFYCYNQPDIVLKVATFWLIRLANTWKRVKFRTFLQKLNLETFDIVSLQFGSQNYVASGNVNAIVEKANYNSADNYVEFECLTPVRAGEMAAYPFFWPSQVEPSTTWPTQAEIEAGYAGGSNVGVGVIGELPIGDLEEGFKDMYSGGNFTYGDRYPSDQHFSPKPLPSTAIYEEVKQDKKELKPEANLTLNYTNLPMIPPTHSTPEAPSVSTGITQIDIRTTTIVDSKTGFTCTLDTFFKKISEAKTLVVDTAKAKFGNDAQPDGKPFAFQYDTEAEKFGTDIAYLKE